MPISRNSRDIAGDRSDGGLNLQRGNGRGTTNSSSSDEEMHKRVPVKRVSPRAEPIKSGLNIQRGDGRGTTSSSSSSDAEMHERVPVKRVSLRAEPFMSYRDLELAEEGLAGRDDSGIMSQVRSSL